MRILHIIDSLGVGGAEKLLVDFIKGYKLKKPSSQHFIVILNDEKDLLPNVSAFIENYQIIHFKKTRILSALLKLKKITKSIKPDIIHSHLFYSTILSRLATQRQTPIVSTYHNMEYSKESPTFSSKFICIDRLTFNNKKHYSIYVSNAVKACVQKAVPAQRDRSRVVYNFVSPAYFNQYKYNGSKKLRIVSVGNLKTVKNHLYALMELTLIRDLDISFDIYGEGDLHNELIEFIERNGLKVRLMGKQNITSALLCQYDLFLLPSISEGMPVSLIEAIVSGLPSLVSDLPQLKETAGDSALYFSPTTPGSLASLLREVYDHKETLIALSKATELLSQKYQWENYYKALVEVYNQALKTDY